MKIRLTCVGAIRNTNISSAIDNYSSRITHYWPFMLSVIPDIRQNRSADSSRQKELEGERILNDIEKGDFLVLFDERGKEMTSRQFSEFIERKSVELPRNLVFVIGGPYGFSSAVYERADMMLSLSKMTFPHELARLFAVEQIYRAGTISRGEPYHHD